MDSSRIQRLSSTVAIGFATQLSSEVIASKSSAHSFWIIIAISLGMMVIQVIFQELLKLKDKIERADNKNWAMWVTTLAQTVLGIETIIWYFYFFIFFCFFLFFLKKIFFEKDIWYCGGPVDFEDVQ